jgi:hypothetical protein
MKIEKNVPLPEGNRGYGKYKEILSQMQDGDSVLCTATEAQGMRTAGKRLRVKTVSRAEGNMRRVWRISNAQPNI